MRAALTAGLISVCMIGSGGRGRSNAQTVPPYPPPGKMVDLGGYRVHLNCTGSGKPTVMIVGAGYSFDWSLVQPAVSTFARVCTYDPPGSVWSDAGPPPTCDGRVLEIHKMVASAGIDGPLVLVGHSIGAVFARLHASRYPAEVAGMVLVDHAGAYKFSPGDPPLAGRSAATASGEDSEKRLPPMAQEIHRWTSARDAGHAGPMIPFFNSCIAEVAKKDPGHAAIAAPLIVIANSALARLADYQSAQAGLLALSRNSKAMVARTSGHLVPMDDPDTVIEAIRQVVTAARNKAKLQ